MTNDERLAIHDAQIAAALEELKQQREDMRRHLARQDALQAQHDAEMKELRKQQDADRLAAEAKTNQTFKELLQKMHDNFVQTMIGIAAMIIALGAFLKS